MRPRLPGVPDVAVPRFRIVLAGTLLLVTVVILGLMLLRQANDPAGQFGIDFGDYRAASQRMGAGSSPYAPEMLTGPIDAQGTDRYRYPPLFAQVLVPFNGLSVGAASAIWLLVQAAAAYAAVWLATGLGGVRRSPELALWCGVAAAAFLPVFDTLWKGNVSAVVALRCLIAGGGGPGRLSARLLRCRRLRSYRWHWRAIVVSGPGPPWPWYSSSVRVCCSHPRHGSTTCASSEPA